MEVPTRVAALRWYRCLLRQGAANLRYTDQDFYRRTVRMEFEKNRHLTNPKDIKFQIKVREK